MACRVTRLSVAGAVAGAVVAEAGFLAATRHGTRCTARAGNPSRTASPPRWPFLSRAFAIRRVGREVPHRWGFQIVREIRGKNETVVWSPVSRDIAGFLPQMGVLDGMMGLSTSRNLEIQPMFTAFRFGTLDEGIGKVVDGDPRPEAGANFKYGVTSNLTADFTLNPDFSQIESDRPRVEVNQRFALFFHELAAVLSRRRRNLPDPGAGDGRPHPNDRSIPCTAPS